jgi:hypothetical protein
MRLGSLIESVIYPSAQPLNETTQESIVGSLLSLRVARSAAEDRATCVREIESVAEGIDKHHIQTTPRPF